jgi:predicted  nucleic acid-binding Zn-ribbon protein
LEERLEEVFQKIPESALAGEISVEEKLQKIMQAMDGYKQEIRELVEKITPTTPPKVRTERE